MSRQKALFLLVLPLLATAQQPPKKIARAADLPQFQYSVQGTVENLIKSDELFRPFAVQIRKNVESVLRDYEIEDAQIKRSLLNTLAALDLLEGRDQELRPRLDEIRALEEKPALKLMSGLIERAILDARAHSRDRSSLAYRQAFSTSLRQALESMPSDVVQNDVKLVRARGPGPRGTATDAILIGTIRTVYDPVVRKTGALSSNLAHNLPYMRVALTEIIPLTDTLREALGDYLIANVKEKRDIWAERDVTLAAGKNDAPVTVAVWDSGVDIGVFQSQTKRDISGSPAVIAYDLYWKRTSGELRPLTPEQHRRYPEVKALFKGMSDLEAGIDSKEAAETRRVRAELTPEQARTFLDERNLFSNYAHGTHVTSIVLAGNPYARLVVGRQTADVMSEICRSREVSERVAAAFQDFVDFYRKNGVRVVNMSWGQPVRDFETRLQRCTGGISADERRKLARELFEIEKRGMEKAFRSAPEILFVAGAGNENSDSSFNEFIPASIVLPNLMAVGAVDRAGDEAAFTSYGPTVVVHANGYEVEGYLPGGDRVKGSGTSFAAPQVTNLAAKMLVVNPKLTAEEVKQIIVGTADRTADGRRNLINPKKAVAAATQRK